MSKQLAPSTGNAEYQKKVAALKADREAQIPKELRLPKDLLESLPTDVTGIPASCGLLSKDELAITDLDATEIRDRIASGKLTAVDVITAFGKRAAIAQQLVACLTDWFLPEALVRAKWLDDYYAKNGKVVGVCAPVIEVARWSSNSLPMLLDSRCMACPSLSRFGKHSVILG
jgi:amidase